MTTTPTLTQDELRLLAKMLPDKLHMYKNPQFKNATLLWNNKDQRFVEAVKPTEYAFLVSVVEKAYCNTPHSGYVSNLENYSNKLMAVIRDELNIMNINARYMTAIATESQRLAALAKTLNMEKV